MLNVNKLAINSTKWMQCKSLMAWLVISITDFSSFTFFWELDYCIAIYIADYSAWPSVL